MMGQHDRSESLFYYFRIEDQVPENHLLGFIDGYVSFDFVREKLRASYSATNICAISQKRSAIHRRAGNMAEGNDAQSAAISCLGLFASLRSIISRAAALS